MRTVCPGSSDPPEKKILVYLHQKIRFTQFFKLLQTATECPGSSDPPEKTLNIFASENAIYTIF